MRVAVAHDTAILAAVYHRQKEIVDLLLSRVATMTPFEAAFSDRGYTINTSGTYRFAHDVRLGPRPRSAPVVARFARVFLRSALSRRSASHRGTPPLKLRWDGGPVAWL